jgi:hypothetical protein
MRCCWCGCGSPGLTTVTGKYFSSPWPRVLSHWGQRCLEYHHPSTSAVPHSPRHSFGDTSARSVLPERSCRNCLCRECELAPGWGTGMGSISVACGYRNWSRSCRGRSPLPVGYYRGFDGWRGFCFRVSGFLPVAPSRTGRGHSHRSAFAPGLMPSAIVMKRLLIAAVGFWVAAAVVSASIVIVGPAVGAPTVKGDAAAWARSSRP